MKRKYAILKSVWEIVLLGGLVIAIVLIFRLTGGIPGTSPQVPTVYPPPQASPRNFPTEVIVTTPKPTHGPCGKGECTPSPSEIAAEETSRAEEATYAAQYLLITPPPPPTPVYYPVNSIEDMPNVVFNDPFFGNVNNGDFGFCLQANQPGKSIFIKSLDNEGGYYIVPFFKDENVCGLFLVTVENGLGTVAAGGQGRGTKFPALDAEEAKALIEKDTGQAIIGEPFLAFRKIREIPDPFSPFWVVTTVNDQTYYVVGLMGSNDAYILNLSEVHPINP